MSLLALLRQRFEVPDRPTRGQRRCRRDDGIGVDAVVPIKLRDRAGLPEMLDAERAHAMAVDGAEPDERRRMAVEHGHDPAMGRHIGHELFDMRARARGAAVQPALSRSAEVTASRPTSRRSSAISPTAWIASGTTAPV